MEREVDNIFTGVCVAVIVCIVSGFLYYMFKHAAFVPSRSVPITRDIIGLRKKVKKSDSKKSKKAKKTKQVLELDELAEQEVDKTQTSDENFDEDEEPLQDTPDELEKDDSPIPSGEKTDGPLCKPVTPMTTVSPPGDLANGDLATGKSSAEQKSQLTSEHSQEPKISNNDSDFADQPEAPLVVSSEEFAQSVPLEAVPLKSKRSKRRKSKRSTPPATPLPVEPILDLPCVEQVAGPSEKLPQLVPTKIPTSADDSQAQESHEDLKKLTDQLNANQNKLAEVSKQVVTLSEENKRLRVKEEETTLGLRVLQEQYTELLRTNKSLEHERSLKDIKLKNLESEKSNILSRLDHTNSEVGRLKNEAEMETRKLREQLAESKSKLATMAAAIASAPPPGPSPELVRAQELAQAVSSDNCLLKSRLEQMETELSQLRQAGLLQQQELQALRVENRKLHSEKESALGEFQAQRQAEQAESSSRIANYEAQLQHRHHELEAETQRSKDFALKLNEARTELSHVAEREKRQSEIISSLEYQFAELNAEKQRLTEEVNRTKALNETCANELRIQVANMTNDLQRTTNELHDVRQRADRLAAELEVMKQSTTDSLVPSPPVSVSVSVETTETIVDMVDEEKRKQSTATEEAEEYKKKTDQIIEHIRTQLSTKEQQLKEAEENAEGAQRRVEEATMELTHYKTTLLETEKVLANLQRSVEKTEKNWTNLLKRSELEQNKLKCELTEVHSQTEKIANRMKELETQLDLERRESSRLRSELVEQTRKFQAQTSSLGEEKTNDLSMISEVCQLPTEPDVQITKTFSEKPPKSVKTDSFKDPTTTDTDRRNLTSLASAEYSSDDGSAVQQRVESTLSLNTSPTCNNESSRSATVVEKDSSEPFSSSNPSDVKLEPQPNSGSSGETIGNVVMFKPNIEQADLASGDPANVMNESPAEGKMTPEYKEVENSRLITTSDGDIDDDFDAVLVDNTDMHVQDDIFDSVTKLSENILEDTPERENSTVRQRKSKVTKASPPAVAGELSE